MMLPATPTTRAREKQMEGWDRAYANYDAWRLAGPPDTDWDKYYNDYEVWLNDNYDTETGLVFGKTWEDACENEDLFQEFVEWWTDRSP
jgi:hypothetical protein